MPIYMVDRDLPGIKMDQLAQIPFTRVIEALDLTP